jgi:predicted RNase H-like HicB family nuclease
VPIHREVLDAARRLCRERGGWTFKAPEVVRALPHLNAGSIRTHVASRCCVNAPRNHPHKWEYFRRVERGLYEILPAWRRSERKSGSPARAVAERSAACRTEPAAQRDTVHAAIRKDGRVYVAEGLEIAVVTQGRTLDEVVANLREAVLLHLEGGDAARLGMAPKPRLSVQLDLAG